MSRDVAAGTGSVACVWYAVVKSGFLRERLITEFAGILKVAFYDCLGVCQVVCRYL